MTTGAEAKVERAAVRYARQQGWRPFKWSSPGRRGVPDRVFFRKKRFVAIEFKRPGGRTTKLQDRTIQQLQEEGFEAYVVDNIEDAKLILA